MKVRVARTLALLGVVASATVFAQIPTVPPGNSPAKAKELVGLLTTKKLESFVVREGSEAGRYVAVLLVPNVQLLLVAATYERPNDIEYYVYNKTPMNAYQDLRSSVLSKKRVFIEDVFCDGLVPQPAKGQAVMDTVTVESEKTVFDGIFADPKKKDPKKISLEDYTKNFTAADDRYSRLLGLLLDELKKS
jgi:hypothetical protein